jgi:hypothetical protein
MEAPAHRFEEHQLVLIDLERVQTGDFAPGAGGVVTVLQIFGRKDQRRQKHPAATLHGPQKRLVPRLLVGEVV